MPSATILPSLPEDISNDSLTEAWEELVRGSEFLAPNRAAQDYWQGRREARGEKNQELSRGASLAPP